MRRVLPSVDAHFMRSKHTATSLGSGLPVLFLTMRGRRTGKPSTVPLLYAEGDAGSLLIAATNWGQRHHPAWSSNLDAHAEVTVTIRGEEQLLQGRRCTPEELERYWPGLVDVWPAFDTYKARSGREIRVFVLEPAGPLTGR